MPDDEPDPGPYNPPLPPELQYRNILNWLYTEDGAHTNKNEWRRKLVEMLEFNILNKRK